MTREVSDGLSKMMALAAALSLVLTYVTSPIFGLAVAVGMLGLLSVALISPMGPKVRWNVPGEQPQQLGLGEIRADYLDGEIDEDELEDRVTEQLKSE